MPFRAWLTSDGPLGQKLESVCDRTEFGHEGEIVNADLKRAKKDRVLMTIARPSIDDRSITGFLLEYSRELILIQYVYDFHLDGLMVLRRSDVEEIKSSRTDHYQTEMMKAEGLYQTVDFNAKHTVSNWPETIKHFQGQYRFVIIEAEATKPNLFALGRIENIQKQSVTLHGFNGVGEWHDEPTIVPFADITCLQVGSNYISMYERHLP
jgi:hypothetical protein